MVTVTDNGLELISDELLDVYDEIAVGTGTTDDAAGDTSLESETYRAQVSDSIVEFRETGGTGDYEAAIEVGGGLEVPAETEISEIGLFANGTLVVRDVFAAVTVEAGHRREFTIDGDITR